MADHVHRPTVPQHFVGLGLAHAEVIPFRNRLKAFALVDGQFADNIQAVRKSDRVLLPLDFDKSVRDGIDMVRLPAGGYNHHAALVAVRRHGVRLLIASDFVERRTVTAPPCDTGRNRI